MLLETICFLFLFCTRFFIRIFILFYLYTFILEMLGKLLKSLWNFPFLFSHLFMPSQFFDKSKRTGVKTEQLKILT